jgi:hypothetical protein
VGHSKVGHKRETYSHERPHQKIREIPNNLIMYLKLLEKQKQADLKSSRLKEIIRAEINELQTKRMNGSLKQKVGSLKT